MTTFLYFAYGSNMLTERLRKRCPSAQPVGTAVAQGYRLCFSKKSDDNSGKATLEKFDDLKQRAYGVLFEIDEGDRSALDDAEGVGKGYNQNDDFQIVCLTDGKKRRATVYLASLDAIDENLIPYDWYYALVLAGAIQHRLPIACIADIRRVMAQPDPQLDRTRRRKALHVLERAGFQWLLKHHP